MQTAKNLLVVWSHNNLTLILGRLCPQQFQLNARAFGGHSSYQIVHESLSCSIAFLKNVLSAVNLVFFGRLNDVALSTESDVYAYRIDFLC